MWKLKNLIMVLLLFFFIHNFSINANTTELPPDYKEIASLGDELCMSWVNFDIEKALNLYHPELIKRAKQNWKDQDVGWEELKKMMLKRSLQNPTNLCQTVGIDLTSCQENPSQEIKYLLPNMGINVEECGVIKQRLETFGIENKGFFNVVKNNGKWYWSGILTDKNFLKMVERRMMRVEGVKIEWDSQRSDDKKKSNVNMWHKEIAEVGKKFCMLTDAGDIELTFEMLHPVYFEYLKKTINASVEGGWDKTIEYAKTKIKESPQKDCQIIETGENICKKNTLLIYSSLGIKIEKCGFFVSTSLIMGQKIEAEMGTVYIDRKWYLMENF